MSFLSRGSGVFMYVYPKCSLIGKKSGITYNIKWTTCNILYFPREKRCPSCVLPCIARKNRCARMHVCMCRKVKWITMCTYIMHKVFINISCIILRLNWRTWQNSAAVQETSRHLYQEGTWQFIWRHSVALHNISKCHYYWKLLNSTYRWTQV